MEQLQTVFYFIGVDQDRGKITAIIHASGAISVFIFGVIYLRSRRVDEISSIFEFEYDFSDNEEEMQNESGVSARQAQLQAINDGNEEDSSFEEENENDYLIWRIYDKIIIAITSEFVVINLCRLGLCFWVLRYNCVQSIVIVIFLFHSTLVKSMIGFLPIIKYVYMPYLFLNMLYFYIINVMIKLPDDTQESLKNIKFGIIVFESPALEFPIMLLVISLVALLVIKVENLNKLLGEEDEAKYEIKKKQKTLKIIQNQSTVLSIMYYVFYLSIEGLLLFILLMNVVSKVNLSNFCLNLYMVVYLIYPSGARRNIRTFLFIIEVFNLINYVYGIIIASSEGIFYAGEIGNLIGIDSYEVHVRKYFNVIPTLRIIALIIVTMTIWNTLPNDNDEQEDDFEAKLYKTLYGYSRCFTEFIYTFFNFCKRMLIWICYFLIFIILIINDH
jgi:hypothetical protein